MSLDKIGLLICVDKGGQAGARCYNTSVHRQGYSSSVQQQEYNWAKQSVCAANIDKKAQAYSIIPEEIQYFPQRFLPPDGSKKSQIIFILMFIIRS